MAPSIATPRFYPPRDVTALALLGAAMVTWRWLHFTRCMRLGDELANAALAFECCAAESGPRVLILGDSIAVGCGAACPEDSIAGQISQEFPHVTIVNRARNGARTAETLAQLSADPHPAYDAILINVGGNDILKRTPFRLLPPRSMRCSRGHASALRTRHRDHDAEHRARSDVLRAAVLVVDTPLAPGARPVRPRVQTPRRTLRELLPPALDGPVPPRQSVLRPRPAAPVDRVLSLHLRDAARRYAARTRTGSRVALTGTDLGAHVDQFRKERDLERSPKEATPDEPRSPACGR